MRFIPTDTFFNLSEAKQKRIMDAATNEFAQHRFHNAKLSNIIREAKIPRGSFYQYFEDKLDLYRYLFDLIAKCKMEYLVDLLPNYEDLPFFEIFYELYKRGAKFGIENPKYVEITSHLLSVKDEIYYELLGNNLQIAVDMYVKYIERDKKLGRIRQEVDSETLAKLVIDMTLNVAMEEVLQHGKKLDFDEMIKNIKKVMFIFEKGITTGE